MRNVLGPLETISIHNSEVDCPNPWGRNRFPVCGVGWGQDNSKIDRCCETGIFLTGCAKKCIWRLCIVGTLLSLHARRLRRFVCWPVSSRVGLPPFSPPLAPGTLNASLLLKQLAINQQRQMPPTEWNTHADFGREHFSHTEWLKRLCESGGPGAGLCDRKGTGVWGLVGGKGVGDGLMRIVPC